jgi:hypothetical protein
MVMLRVVAGEITCDRQQRVKADNAPVVCGRTWQPMWRGYLNVGECTRRDSAGHLHAGGRLSARLPDQAIVGVVRRFRHVRRIGCVCRLQPVFVDGRAQLRKAVGLRHAGDAPAEPDVTYA